MYILGLVSKTLPTLQDQERIVMNRKLLDIALPAVFTLMIVVMTLQTRDAGTGLGRTTLTANF